MKLQDLFPYDAALLGLEDQFQTVGADSFMINSDCILTANHVVTTGKTYILFDFIEGKVVKATPVVLKRVLYIKDAVHVSLVDMLTQEVQVRTVKVGNAASKRQWKLCDLDVIVNANNLDIVEDCIAGDNDELLEFCF